MPAFPFIGAAYEARSVNFDCQRCVNLYPEVSESGTSKSVAALIGTPGMRLYSNSTADGKASRGLYRFSDTVSIRIVGSVVSKLERQPLVPGYTEVVIGSIIERPTLVTMTDNGTTIMLVTGFAEGYFIDVAANTVTQIVSPDFVGATGCGFIGGRFVWNKLGTAQWQYTEPYSTVIDPLNFYTAESSPDSLSTLIVNHSEIWLPGPDSFETWVLTGDNTDPFTRIQGAQMETGIDAPRSLAKMDNTIFWLGGDARGRGMVMKAVGYSNAQRVSTHAIEYAIAQYGDVSDAIAFTYQQEGHTFYVLTFPTASKTWVFDASTSLWHERAHMDTDGNYQRVRACCQMAWDNRILVGDYLGGGLYEYDLDHFTDPPGLTGFATRYIPRVRVAPHLSQDLKNQLFHSLQIDMQTGVGLNEIPTNYGHDPQAMLQWSDDGGHSWSAEAWAPIGKLGEYRTRVRWRRLGMSRDRVFKVVITDPVKVVLIGATVEVTPCPT
jgi:hypothetical protein